MPRAVTISELSTKHKLLDPKGPVCLIIQAQMGVAAGLDRFQPAGFPEVGHVIYAAAISTLEQILKMVLCDDSNQEACKANSCSTAAAPA